MPASANAPENFASPRDLDRLRILVDGLEVDATAGTTFRLTVSGES